MGKFPASPSVGIIGGGVAGMSCALWLTQLGHQAVIIERAGQLGGQLLGIDRINRWVLGFPELSSRELAGRYAEHVARTPTVLCFDSRIQAIEAEPDGYRVQLADNEQAHALNAKALVIATGVRSLGAERFNGLPGFTAAYHSGLISFYPLDHLDKLSEFKGQRIAVIGGGDNAYFTAKDAALAGAHVHLVLRSSSKAQRSVRDEVAALVGRGWVTEHHETVATAFRSAQKGIELLLSQAEQTGAWLKVDRIFARIGFAANSEFLDGFAAFSGLRKQNGYICTDAGKRTNLPWLYAIGDVANPKHSSVVGAIADGALAAQDFNGRRI